MQNTFTITNEGLRELPDDNRDFPLGAVFGTIDIREVPTTDFIVSQPLCIKDQGDTDFCSAYAVTSVSEDQEKVYLLPEYQFYSTKRITGDPESWGADLRSACKSAVKYGSLAEVSAPQMKGQPRSFILDAGNWPEKADWMASTHKKETYFAVTGPYDLFDNVRAALWQHRDDKATIVTGACWRNAWIGAKNGIIPDVPTGDGFGHAFKLYGQKVIDGELYLMAQLSNGEAIGDRGIYYFNRDVANRELAKYGLYMFKDIPREEAEHYLDKPYTINDSFFKKLIALITNLFHL